VEQPPLYPALQNYAELRVHEFDQISAERKSQLAKLAAFVQQWHRQESPCRIIFVCTHNSRRSQMAQAWTQVAAEFYGIQGIECYSGGTESTAMNPRTVASLKRAGFQIQAANSDTNPLYHVQLRPNSAPSNFFSKLVHDASNPSREFVAVMTCSEADQSCPDVKGSSLRLALPFEDPKISDNTPAETETYDARCQQIAREMLYVMSQVKS
jgi:arsenate reductase (thioredoxin)